MSLSEDKRFDSWKEIASFLGRDVRTVRRWEEERGLPVRRVPGEGRRTIFAYQSEIEAWLRAEHLSDKEISTKALSQNGPSTAKNNRALVWGIVSISLVCIIGITMLHASGALNRLLGRHPTRIERVSPIYAAKTQGIIVDGEGFGPPPKTIRLAPDDGIDTYAESYSTSMRIDNLGEGRHKWVAGRGGPLNYCSISLRLASWTDNRIVLAGFAGPVGTNCADEYQIAPGDRLRIIVWGPKNKCGPGGPEQCPDEVKSGRVATYDSIVLPSKDVPVSLCR